MSFDLINMDKPIPHNPYPSLREITLLVVVCLFGIWMIVVVPLGTRLANMPGEIGDTRLNTYLLEHFFRWISGLDKSFWSPDIFFPFPYTIAFSDNFLGSGLFYSLFRWAGLDQDTAFQGWYILGYFLNYFAAAFVLARLKFNPIGIAAGAFFFAFGLPALAKENHIQLLYRFCVPLACLSLWRLFELPKLRSLLTLLFLTVWQFYSSIYTGVFLFFLLFALAALLPFFKHDRTFIGLVKFWPGLIKSMWNLSTFRERLLAPFGIALLFLALGALLWPYYQVTKLYGFTRVSDEVATMLLNWRSFFIADRSLIWGPISKLIENFPMRHEHNIFIGLPAVVCILISFVWHRSPHNKKMVFLHVFAAILVVVFTSRFRGFSLYSLIWPLPGLSSIRAVSRIILILMWPISLCIAYTIDQLLGRTKRQTVLLSGIAYLLVFSLMLEPVFFEHRIFSKSDAQKRVTTYLSQIPTSLPDQPILFVADANNTEISEIDGMLLAQSLGWPSLNGYSGNKPPGYGSTNSCRNIQQRILAYMDYARIYSESYYITMITRVVPLGFEVCSPMVAVRKPQIFAGPLPQEIFEGVTINIVTLQKVDSGIRAEVMVANHSSLNLPAFSSTDNPVLISWHLVNVDTGEELSGFNEKKYLDNDIYPGENAISTIDVVPPELPGQYQLEVTAVQEHVDWFYNRGLPVAESSQVIHVDNQNNLTISTPTP